MNSAPNLYITGETPEELDPHLLRQALQIFCETLGLSGNISAGLVFCTSDEMKELNRKYRGVDATTDVISFPADRQPGLFPSDETGGIYLGEILVDINQIFSASGTNERYKEFIPVFVHGLLHLSGYDHLNAQQKSAMQTMENKILKLIGEDGTSE